MANSGEGRVSTFFAKFRLAYGIVGVAHCDPPDDFGPDNAEMYHPFPTEAIMADPEPEE